MIGTSFSPRHAVELGLDPKETLQRILDLGIRIVRLGVYWDEVQPTQIAFVWKELKWQLDMCEKNHIAVVLCLGMKSPRWPEFYTPVWAQKLESELFESALLDFLKQTVSWANKYSCIEYWQVENEPLDPSGPQNKIIAADLLEREIALVRAVDHRKKTVVVTVWGNEMHRRKTFSFASKQADIIGLDVYPKVFWTRFFGKNFYAPFWLKRYFISRELRQTKKPVWVAELQAEPWEESAIGYRSLNPASMSPQQLLRNWRWAQSLPAIGIFLWGCEYWIWRASQGDLRYVELVRSLASEDYQLE